MKKVCLLVASIIFCFLGCAVEPLEEGLRNSDNNGKGPKSQTETSPEDTSEPTSEDNTETTEEDHCFYTNLMAGQHHVAGSVTIDIDGDNLIITYTTNDDWTIGITHLSVGNCDEDWVPLTRAGNPRIGHFEYTEPFSSSDTEVVYIISLEGLNDSFCFAAHAEVQGPTGGETAWAEGTQFPGKAWGMYVEVDLSDCLETEDEDDEDDDSDMQF